MNDQSRVPDQDEEERQVERLWKYHLFVIRFALEAHGAPERCRNRSCKTSGSCHFSWDGSSRPGVCQAGPITEDVGVLAARLMIFAELLDLWEEAN